MNGLTRKTMAVLSQINNMKDKYDVYSAADNDSGNDTCQTCVRVFV